MKQPIISGKSLLVGVMGWPVKHSLSPAMQNAALEALGMEAAYVPLAVPLGGLTVLIFNEALREMLGKWFLL